jgi:SAM-dependent methyltransferase
MQNLRKPFEGLRNVIRFNWHYYALSAGIAALLSLLGWQLTPPWSYISVAICIVTVLSTLLSLAVTWYVYDHSTLYRFAWMNEFGISPGCRIVNIHAGFDETSKLIRNKYPDGDFEVLDFYNPEKHTELSIKRARKTSLPVPGTVQVSSDYLPERSGSVDLVFSILSAHEIRSKEERVAFFNELHRILTPTGKLFITEHLRNIPNFVAYNLGCLHFHSRNTWLRTFDKSGFIVTEEIKTTPFITTFILSKNGILS